MASNGSLPKYLEIAQSIEQELGTHHPAGFKLPTVRGIAERHKVSIVTASRALQVLRDKGLVQTIERSGCYLNPHAAIATMESYALIQHLTPGAWYHATIALVQGPFEQYAKQVGFQLHTRWQIGDRPHTLADIESNVKNLLDAGVKGLFYLPSRISDESARIDEQLLACCAQNGIAIVLLERNLRGDHRSLQYDLVASDDFTAGQLLTNHLLQLGRKRIAFITGSPTSCHNHRMAGYLFAIHRATGMEPIVLQQIAGPPGKRAYHDLVTRLMALQVDGVICYEDYTAIGVIVEAMSRRLRIPEDLAVTGFDDLPIGDSFAIGVTTYGMPVTRMAVEALRLMRHRLSEPDAPRIQVVVPGDLFIRESSTLDSESR